MRSLRTSRPRRAFLTIELAVASLLMVSSMVILGRLAITQTHVMQQRKVTLQSSITMENVVERIANSTVNDFPRRLDQIRSEPAFANMILEAKRFTPNATSGGATSGWHVMIHDKRAPHLVTHWWCLDQASDSNASSSETSEESS